MAEEKVKELMIFASLIGVIGLILIFFSGFFGTAVADNWLINQGAVDTEEYLMRTDNNISNFRLTGGILFGIAIFIYYKILLEK